jgi:hypothetical protein
LELGSCNKDSILNWLLSGDSTPAVTEFRIAAVMLEETSAIGTFLQAIGPWLEHLELGFARPVMPSRDGEIESAHIPILSRLCSLLTIGLQLQKHSAVTLTSPAI